MLSWTSQDCQSFQEYFRETKTITFGNRYIFRIAKYKSELY